MVLTATVDAPPLLPPPLVNDSESCPFLVGYEVRMPSADFGGRAVASNRDTCEHNVTIVIATAMRMDLWNIILDVCGSRVALWFSMVGREKL
mmetsp:Transcript_4060/g.6177  ORF Transcript_4060/g.6177 Transcript_4060/m.6177 type:complete len:92 (-) Transcript_4060:106-381(-)